MDPSSNSFPGFWSGSVPYSRFRILNTAVKNSANNIFEKYLLTNFFHLTIFISKLLQPWQIWNICQFIDTANHVKKKWKSEFQQNCVLFISIILCVTDIRIILSVADPTAFRFGSGSDRQANYRSRSDLTGTFRIGVPILSG